MPIETSDELDKSLGGPGTSATVTFEQPGVHRYFCDIHRGMDARVIVRG